MSDKVEQLKRRDNLNDAYWRVFNGVPNAHDGAAVLEDLKKRFQQRTTIKTVDHMVDPYASIAAAGAAEVILYIDGRISNARMVGKP